MNIRSCPKIFSALLLGAALQARAGSHDTVGNPVSLDNNTYSITCEATNGFMRDEDQLKADASAAAEKFCAAQGKTLKIISVKSKMPTFSTGYGWAKITFMALNPGEPIMSAPAAPMGAPGSGSGAAYAGAPAAPAAPLSLTTDEMYTQLLKLDDLRKKGILTEEEFQAEKKKVLSHTN